LELILIFGLGSVHDSVAEHHWINGSVRCRARLLVVHNHLLSMTNQC
jgi:hypothetical protein